MAEDESDQESERLGEELEALVAPGLPAGLPPLLRGQYYCRRFCQVVEDYAGRWQVPLPQLEVLQTALCCFTSACVSFPAECEQHVQYVLSSLALSFFELLLFFGKDEFYEDPLKDILGSIQECQNLLSRYGNMNLELVTRIIRDGGPWEDPVLQAVLKAKPVSQELVNKYLSSENPLFFELRARYLIACERIPEAMALIKACINHPDISKDLYFHQALFTCLYMSPLEDQLFQEHLLRTDCRSGIEIICNTEKEGKTTLALQLCESFLVPQLQSGDMYCIWDLIFIWSKLQLKSNPSKQVFVDQCYQLLRIATNVRVIFPFMKIIKDEVGEDGLQICVEICGCALQLDLRDDPIMKSLIYKTIAHFLPNDLEILRICALSVFFLERTLESYYTVERLYKCADEEYNERASSVQNRVRFELLPIVKKGLFFDPEFWNFLMIKQNCLALLGDKASVGLGESTLENSAANTEKLTEHQSLGEDHVCLADLSSGEFDPEDLSGAQSKGHGNAKKNYAALGAASKMIDHNVPRHRCVLCNKEFLGGHIVRHAQSHQKKGSFSCVICSRKFRQRGLMLKHLKNHVKKIQRQHLAVVQQEDSETPVLNELNCSEASISFENGSSDSSKDNEPEVAIIPSADTEADNPEPVSDVVENHVSEQVDVVENGSYDSYLNNTLEPLTTESLPESEESPNMESPILHKVNGALCSQKDLDVMDQEGNFKCPASGCVRVFKKIRFLNKHARKAHPTDLKVQQHIMKWNKGKCRFCQRKFADSQHFIDHLKRHVYPNVYFCLHVNCNQRFKLSTELAEHTKSHDVFKAQCNFAECCELFEELPLLYEHEAQHYLNRTPESSEEVSEKISSDNLSELHCDSTEKDASSNEKETVDLPIPTWKARKDSTEPKTYIQSVEKKTNNILPNGNESSDVNATFLSLLDQKTPVVQPNSETCSVVSDQLVNGHSELEQTTSDTPLDRVADETRTENGSLLPVLQNCYDMPQNNIAAVSQLPSKPNQTTENTSYGLILTKPYVRPLPPSYLDERYISMPKRRKTLTDKVDAHSEQDKVCSKSPERFRCGNCLTTYCNSEALEAHLAQKKCQTLFGFDSDDESA
ncbi:zinc finger protein 654 [Alligator mississippiensis]|uniref:zinc finger protein 654 n=1 Tax=Alligator mississippiensis TaxID=8496 RepID=UPI0028779C5E|nr:zinc finger protein 654 [Alligator mississippiensis]